MGKNIAAVIIVAIFFQHFIATSYAAEATPNTANDTIQYDLSYPGLLPDHPLYILKQVRDNMMALFIGKPLERSSFMLLQSDKQISAAKLLVDQKKDLTMIRDSFTASQKSFEEAVEVTQAAKQEGLATGDMINKLRIASKKHNEIVREITAQLSPEEKKMFSDIEKKSLEFIPLTASLKS